MRRTVRFTPTPSGFLHVGNAANALLCSWWAEQLDADVVLRLDDLDRDRYRPEYEDDIFDLLEWFNIPIAVFYRESEHFPQYEEARELLSSTSDLVFACKCSRRDLALERECGCAALNLPLEVNRTTLKWRSTAGDVVIWRRDGLPSLHLASVVDDEVLKITNVVRGDDLRESTAIQLELAEVLGLQTPGQADIRFHSLIRDSDGLKLSKSQLRSGPLPRTRETWEAIFDAAELFATSAQIMIPSSDSRS